MMVEQSLLDLLSIQMGCMYLSDLRSLPPEQRRRIQPRQQKRGSSICYPNLARQGSITYVILGGSKMRSKVRTRIGSMLVCLAMLLSLLPVTALAAEGTECTESDCAHVAAIGNTHYGTLADAFNAAIDGDTVKVLKDSNIDEGIEISEGNVVLDLNGKTVLLILMVPQM